MGAYKLSETRFQPVVWTEEYLEAQNQIKSK